MKTVNLRTFGMLTLSTMLISCGGGRELYTGIFSDSPVAGLSYATPTVHGVTDEDGVFTYRENETVVFSIGKLALPVVAASELITPLDMAFSQDVTDPDVINIARLLQSLDEDSDPENGISIPADAAAAFTEATIFDFTDDGLNIGPFWKSNPNYTGDFAFNQVCIVLPDKFCQCIDICSFRDLKKYFILDMK